MAICELENINDANKAEVLKGEKIFVERSKFPLLENGEYYQSDLIDCKVYDLEGEYLGKLMQFMILELGQY